MSGTACSMRVLRRFCACATKWDDTGSSGRKGGNKIILDEGGSGPGERGTLWPRSYCPEWAPLDDQRDWPAPKLISINFNQGQSCGGAWPCGCILWFLPAGGSAMSIPPGTKLGSYQIIGAIGAGGMGEVYQAHDTKLGRDVAIKVLPEAFAHDPERLARFQREAKTLASLNHPNIAQIFGLEEYAGASYLVMELVPGDTLADRIKRSGAIPLDEAINIAKQMAEALKAAHEKEIIHRDLKPANVKVTPDGKV